MIRECTRCGRPFTPRDLAREETEGMEADRKALGLTGVAFRYYTCPACAQADIFVVLAPLEGEPEEGFRSRRRELERAVAELHAARAKEAEGVQVVLTEPDQPFEE